MPDPAALRHYHGNRSGHSRPLGLEIEETDASLDPPEHLTEPGRILWREIAPILADYGLLTNLDFIALGQLCEAFSDWAAAAQYLATHDLYYAVDDKLSNEHWKVHPAHAVKADADRRLHSWLQEFGLTPSARARWRSPGDRPVATDEGAESDMKSIIENLTAHDREALRQILDRRKAASVATQPHGDQG